MASEAHVSVRTIPRPVYEPNGLAPGEWLHRQRVTYARDLLEETTLSVDEIAIRAGFGTGTNFRQHFRAATGLPPVTYPQQGAAATDTLLQVRGCPNLMDTMTADQTQQHQAAYGRTTSNFSLR
ncbi:MAG TPA: helix-turn-helix domain-containing protein, partial [Tardiphaga sp.]